AAALSLDNAQVRARLEHLALTDSLTGLYNHRYFHERLRGELNRAGRAHDTVALLMLDIDDFKRVNDVCGHGEGDSVLQLIADEPGGRDLRSIAHLKMLQSLARRLNRLNDVGEIGEAIVDELRMLIDYHDCCVYLLEGDVLRPIAVRGVNEEAISELRLHPGE